MKHEMTLFHTMGPVEMFCSRHTLHTFFLWLYMVLCGHLLTQDDAEQLESVIGYSSLLYLVMKISKNFVVGILWKWVYFTKFMVCYFITILQGTMKLIG